ncbi:putative HMP/thiamine import ATP-binding protein YkoD [Thalassobacillus devorans]|uniref:HMP/thiamine import ATP-binding protein YkoD n=1 Tax=Thalassobacillus devorans TaxID=279813 RepID=A0ABQ1NP00_9BACI|nr:ABC transporter ATP-binding protein [Thalassobacillus devorans]NIK27658.1 energy-coupling factor transport system ATP-binding protein [Thalassobacillus devorans]GGC79505.1 putative HMP/thiamine import ATP-binding protein YkoD [Thalassobacillus devorans]
MAPHDLVEIKDLNVSYEEAKQPVLHGLNLSLSKGETTLLLGPSGSGKSTLMYTLNGLYPEELDGKLTGERLYRERPYESFNPGELSRGIGVVFQEPESQFCMLTVEDEVAFGLENLDTPPDVIAEKVDRALGLVGLSDVKEATITSLSGGMKQKLALACVLAMEPELIILDEPTSLLDPHSRQAFVETVISLQQEKGLGLLIIEHNLDEWLAYVDRCLLMNRNGKLFYDGPLAQGFHEHYETIKKEGIWMPHLFRTAYQLMQQGVINDRKAFPLELEAISRHIPHGFFKGKIPLSSAMPHLSLENVSYKHIIHPVTSTIHKGEWVAIVGANGAGKTTLSLLLAGLMIPSGGTITLNGNCLEDYRSESLWQEVGYVFQSPEHQFVADTVFEEVAFGLRLQERPESEVEERTEVMLEHYGLTAHKDRHPYTLSQGQKRRLSIATMMVENQGLLVLDEPTFGQDEHSAQEIIALLQQRQQEGATLVMVTHDMELVDQHADRALVMENGSLAFDGSPEELWEKGEHWLTHHQLQPPFRVRLEQAAKKGADTIESARA